MVHVAAANLRLAESDISGAREEIQMALNNDDNSAPAWSVLGYLESVESNLEEAEAAYTRAIELRKDNSLDTLKRAEIRFELLDFDGVEQDLNSLKSKNIVSDHIRSDRT